MSNGNAVKGVYCSPLAARPFEQNAGLSASISFLFFFTETEFLKLSLKLSNLEVQLAAANSKMMEQRLEMAQQNQTIGTLQKRLTTVETEQEDHKLQLNKTRLDLTNQQSETRFWRQIADMQSNLTNAVMVNQQQQIVQIKLDHEMYRNKTTVRLDDLNANVTTTARSLSNITGKVNVS